MNKVLLIIDSFALIFRSYYAISTSLKTSDGTPTNAIYGYLSLLANIILKFMPSHIVTVMDSETPTIKKSKYVYYKSNRPKPDKLLVAQIQHIKYISRSIGLSLLEVNGYEADEIIATLVHKVRTKFDKIIVVTGDNDLLQLVNNNTYIYMTGKNFNQSVLYSEDEVVSKIGIKPSQIPDYKALRGDQSDNIPGVSGIGHKTAVALLKEYNNISNIISNLNNIDKKIANKIQNSIEILYQSKELADLISNQIPLSISITDFLLQLKKDYYQVLNQYELKSLIQKYYKIYSTYENNQQLNLST